MNENKDRKNSDEIAELTVKNIPQRFLDYDTIPLFGGAPDFSWEAFSRQLSEQIDLGACRITCQTVEWLDADHLLNHMGKSPFCLSYEVSPLEGFCYTVIDKETLLSLIPELIFKEESFSLPLEEDFLDSFILFISLQIAYAFNEIHYDPILKPNLVGETALPKEDMLGIDVHCTINESTFLLRILFPKPFQQEIVRHFSQKLSKKNSLHLNEELNSYVGVRIGHISLKQDEWASVKPGDYLFLDSYSFDEENGLGMAELVMDETTLCHVDILEEGLKVKEN